MLKYGKGVLIVVVLLISFKQVTLAAPPTTPPVTPAQNLATPQLIEAARARGVIDDDTANLYIAYALGKPALLPVEYHSPVPWRGTLPLLRLQRAVATMATSPMKARIEEVMAGFCGSDSTGALPTSTNSTHFYIEYNTINALTINDYITSLEAAWSKEINSFGWAAPPVFTSNPPPGNLYHVRIDNLATSLYGYVTANGAHAGFVGDNPNTTWNDGDAFATCMVLNRNFDPFPGTAQQALDATTAHEFNHSIQFGYGALTGANTPDDVFVEGGASWMEDEVFDNANDNYNYLYPEFIPSAQASSVSMGEYTGSPYPYWIIFRAMLERYGAGVAGGSEQVMQDFWEATSKGTGNNLSAMNLALVNRGTTLADAYHVAAIALKFLKSCSGAYTYPYCLEESAGYIGATGGVPAVQGTILTIGGSYNGSVQDNYALNWVRLPVGVGAVYRVNLQNTSAGGQLRGSVVCDTGSTLVVHSLSGPVGAGGTGSAFRVDATGCAQAVAVITNQAQTADNPTSSTARSYTLSTTTPVVFTNFVFLPLTLR
jgi:hypothetical protein